MIRKLLLSATAALLCSGPALATDYNQTLNALQVITGSDLGTQPVTLYWGDSVTYELDFTARQLFKFKVVQDAITLISNNSGTSVLGDVTVTRTDSTIKITSNPGSPAWNAKATFFFLPLADKLPAISGLDPIIVNGGRG